MIPGCGIDFERATEKPQSMSLTQSARAGIRDALGVVKLIAGVVLLVALSWEIIAGDHVHMSRTYLAIQFVVCLVFLCDFFVRWAAAERPGRFFWRNLPFLLLSVPYLNILAWSGVGMTHDWGVLVGLIPLLRAFLAMVIIVRWLVSENRMRRLFLPISSPSSSLPISPGWCSTTTRCSSIPSSTASAMRSGGRG